MPRQLRLYEESPVFDAFTRFDTTSGRLTAVSADEFHRVFTRIGMRSTGTASGSNATTPAG